MNISPPCPIELGKGGFVLDGNYAVTFGNHTVGKVQVCREGLYYRFVCRCQLTGDVVCRLAVRCGEQEENLGVVVPMDGVFGLEKKIPAKRLGEDEPFFFLAPKHDHGNGTFVPIYPEEPFAYISRLKDAFLMRQNGQPGVMLKR